MKFGNNKSRKLHNEVLLDTSTLKVRAIIKISKGCDILFEQYKIALEMQRLYNVNIKVINSSLYREKAGLPKYEKWEYELWNQMLDKYNSDYALDYFRKMDIEDINVFLDKYYEEIVMEGHYDQMIKEQLENTIEHLRNLSKQY